MIPTFATTIGSWQAILRDYWRGVAYGIVIPNANVDVIFFAEDSCVDQRTYEKFIKMILEKKSKYAQGGTPHALNLTVVPGTHATAEKLFFHHDYASLAPDLCPYWAKMWGSDRLKAFPRT